MTEQLDGLLISRQGESTTVLLMPGMGQEMTRVLYDVCYSYSGYSVSSSYASHRDCWLHCLCLYLIELENTLIKTMALSFALAFLALLFWTKYLVVSMRKYISLSISRNNADSFIMQASEILVHPYMSLHE